MSLLLQKKFTGSTLYGLVIALRIFRAWVLAVSACAQSSSKHQLVAESFSTGTQMILDLVVFPVVQVKLEEPRPGVPLLNRQARGED